MIEPIFVFVYQHTCGDIRAVSAEEANSFHDSPAWEHIGTLKADTYIQHILKNNPALVDDLRKETEENS